MNELDYITKDELLKNCLEDVKRIAESQFVEIDDEYFLIVNGEKHSPMTMIQGNDVITITFIYNSKDNSFPQIELKINKLRWIRRDGNIVKFKKVIINSI